MSATRKIAVNRPNPENKYPTVILSNAKNLCRILPLTKREREGVAGIYTPTPPTPSRAEGDKTEILHFIQDDK